MAKNLEKLEIYHKAYLFSIYLEQKVTKFDRRYRFTLADKLSDGIDKFICAVLDANRETNKGKAARIIYYALGELDKIEYRTRKAVALNQMSVDTKAKCDIALEDLRSDARRWRKYYLQLCGASAGDAPEEEDTPAESQE